MEFILTLVTIILSFYVVLTRRFGRKSVQIDIENDSQSQIRNSWSIFADIMIQFMQFRRECFVSSEKDIFRTRNRTDKLFIPTNKLRIKIEKVEFKGRDGNIIKGEWLIPRNENNSSKGILYFHGGGFCLCSINTHRKIASQIALASNTRLFIFEYRRTPKFAYPAQVHDGIDAFNFICLNRKAKDIVFIGDSAGGNLAVSVPLHLLKNEDKEKDKDSFLPAAIGTMSAWVDLTNSSNSYSKFYSNDFLPSRENMNFQAKIYTKEVLAECWQVSPVFGDFNGFPPLYLQASECEQLIDDSILLAKNARKSGVNVKFDTWKNQPHVFQAFGGIEAQDAINKMGQWVIQNHHYDSPLNFVKEKSESKIRGNFSEYSRSIDSLKSLISIEAKYSL